MNDVFYEQNGKTYCAKCHQQVDVDNEGPSIIYRCPQHGMILFGMGGGKSFLRPAHSPESLSDPQKYTLTLLEMPEGRLKTIATLAGLTEKPSWLLREQFLEGQWIFPEPLLAQQVLDWMPKLKQRGVPFKIAPDFPWLDGVPDPETPPLF